ncbi:DUF6950 family protein [Shimia haliotis]|uniref:DUF6950 domain-containing protein n=1 Tax=Shimia haliotis TaxID=1280847 RepID=A0A1I4CBD2_9RHOB|nr:hypothetical protein [Shimia haliotis]SFK78245.1 hypothetical protein SAMN04488036_102161 [Shimia haliotis]
MRRPDWQNRLAGAIEAARETPFSWGTHDCATWAFDLRRDLTGGEDIAALWRGRYRTALGAHRIMKRLGWGSLEAAGRDLLGTPLPSVLQAGRGDQVLGGSGPAYGVCVGAKVAFVAPDGLVFISLSDCSLAWRV